jgi:TolA-binding protein
VVTETANAFRKRKCVNEAIAVYQKARKLNNNTILYSTELGQLYAEKGDIGLMVQEYLNTLEVNPNAIEDVQGYLQLYLDNDADFDQLKVTLQKKLKEKPGNELYSEMMIWLFVQRKDFDNALVYTRALDKRLKEDGRRISYLADIAIANQRYDAASKIYQEVIIMGNEKPYYLNAKLGVLRAKNLKIFYQGSYTKQDLLSLEQEYNLFLNEFGKHPSTASSVKELAQLQAFYLFSYDSAIANYEELINMPRLDGKFKALCKLELGDIYILKEEVWEAMLLYGQVDKEFLEDPLGQEAKFRNAKLSYYLGEFEWARAQLDVLKTATTQLISNNAIELSLQIQDNTIDSNEEPLRMFARADLFYFQNHLTQAQEVLDSLTALYPRHDLTDDIIYKRAEIAIKQKDYTEAAKLFEQLYKEHGTDILGDNALFYLADLYESKLNNAEQAKKYYEEFIECYSGSFFLTEVRKRYRALRGDATN